MSSMAGSRSVDGDDDGARRREGGSPIWPAGPRGVLAAAVIAAALGLALGSRGAEPPHDGIVAAPKLKLDPNTAPGQVLGALPQVGPSLVRQLVLARQDRPLRSLEDLHSRVRGVGPATLGQLAPYLRFEPAVGSSPDQVAGFDDGRPAQKPRAKTRKKLRSPIPAPVRADAQLVAQTAEADAQ